MARRWQPRRANFTGAAFSSGALPVRPARLRRALVSARRARRPAARAPSSSAAALARTDLYVARRGPAAAHAPPAVFVHDFMTDSRLFDRLLGDGSPLPRAAHCAAYDLRGFGNSPDPAGPYSRLEDLAAVHRGVGDAPCHLVGCGLGGTVAMEYALWRPESVLSVSLISSGMQGHTWRRGDASFFQLPFDDEPVEAAEAARAGRALARDWIRGNLEWRAALRKGGDVAAVLQEMYRSYKCFHFWGEEELVPDPYEGLPLLARIKDLEVPVLAMVGAEENCEGCDDFVVIADEILAEVPYPAFAVAKPHFLEGAGHFGAYEAPEQCFTLVSQFWKSVERHGEQREATFPSQAA